VEADHGFHCATCGLFHSGLPLSYGFGAPIQWKSEFAAQPGYELGEERCVIAGRGFFIKGNIALPIIGRNDAFVWTVWVSLSERSFERARALWKDPNRMNEPPYFGWLSNSLPLYPETLNLKTSVQEEMPGVRPSVELEPTAHPLGSRAT